jgi:broad specificity phosphatase PhoE
MLSPMSKLLLVRHGQTDGNVKHLAQGHTNIPLNETGQDQAEALAHRMSRNHTDIVAIYASDLSRAHETANKTAAKLGLPVETRKNLRERHFGIAEGTPVPDLIRQYGDPHWIHAPIPNSESQGELLLRLTRELHSIALQHKGEKVAIFSHGLAIRTLIIASVGEEAVPYVNNCDVAIFSVDFTAQGPHLRFESLDGTL